MGLGFTFYSGAMEAWLVDALAATGYRGLLDRVFARGQQITGAAMLVGTVGGGLLGQINLSLPYVVRSALLAAVFVVAYVVMHDIGFSRETRDGRPSSRARSRGTPRPGSSSVGGSARCDCSCSPRSCRAAFLMWGFYASQPYLLELLDSDAIWIAGLVAAGVALATIVGNQVVRVASRYCGRRTTLLLDRRSGPGGRGRSPSGLASSFWVALPALAPRHGGDGRDEPGALRLSPPGRSDRAARDGRVLRLHGLERRRDRRTDRPWCARRSAQRGLGVRRRRSS